jgi:hypothetical protein
LKKIRCGYCGWRASLPFSAPGQEFSVAPETMQLMRNMVAAGEVDALVPERVWQEIARGLMEQRPSRMIEILKECGALARLLPELLRLWGVPQPLHYHPEAIPVCIACWSSIEPHSAAIRWLCALPRCCMIWVKA